MNRKKLISSLMAFIMTFSLLFNFGGNGYLKVFAKDGENAIGVEQKENSKNTTPSAIEVEEKETSKNIIPSETENNEKETSKNAIPSESGVEKNKENETTATIEPTSIEVNPGDSFTFNVKTTKGNILSYSSNIPGEGIGFGNSFVFVDDGKAKIELKSDVKPGEYKLSNVGIYDIAGRNPGMIIMNISDNYKVASLPDITIKVKGQNKSIDSISLNKNELNLTVNNSETLIATVLPEDASNKGIKWTSNNPDIASVDENGKVTGLKEGTAIITAKTEDGEKTSNCTVKVVESNTDKKDYKTLVSNSIDKASIKAVDDYNSLDWVAVGLYRSGKGDKIPTNYLSNNGIYLTDLENQDRFASSPTEFERITLGVLSANGNPKNVEGMNLIRKIYNADLGSQGINAIVFGLIALDAGQYDVPKDAKWNREKLINYILNYECTNEHNKKFEDKKGGWAFGGNDADSDMTGMAITALAPYYSGSPKKVSNQISSELKTKVKEAVDRAVDCLSAIQDDDGGYSSGRFPSSESSAQVITGLCANKIDPTGARFTKGDKNVVDALLTYQNEDGGFAHTFDYGKNTNGMSTEQALYALAQYSMYQKGLGSIYDFGDKNSDKDAPVESITGVKLDITELTLEEKGSNAFQRIHANILPVIADNLKIKWESNNEKVATVNKDGGIQAVAPGEATITVTTEDGGKTASCKVTVIKESVKPNEVKLDKDNAEMRIGENLKLTATVLPKEAINQKVIWSSSTDSVVTVDQNGNIKALAEGDTTILVRTEKWEASTQCKITVKQGLIPASLTIEKVENTNIKTGSKIQLKTKVLDKDNKVINDSKIKWTTGNDKIATVDNTGNVIAIGPGTAVISAALEGNGKIKDEVTFNVTENKDIQSIINEVLGYYNSMAGKDNKSFDYIPALSLRRAGMDIDIINKKKNIYGSDTLQNNERNIMTLIASNNNPRNYNKKDYVSQLMKTDFTNEKSSEGIAKAIIALDMAKADYDKEKLTNTLLKFTHNEGDGKISLGTLGDEEYTASIDASAWSLIALSNHKDIKGCNDTIKGIKKYLKSKQLSSGLIDNSADTSLLIQGLIALGENPLDDYWCIKTESGNINLLDAILNCQVNNQFALKEKAMTTDIATSHVFAALTDLKLNSSMYKELSFKDISSIAKIAIDGNKNIEIQKGKTIDLCVKAFDENNILVNGALILWKSSDDKIASVNNGKLTALSTGEAKITAYLGSNEGICETVNVKVAIQPDIDCTEQVQREIEFLKEHYKGYGSYEFLSSPAVAIAGIDKKEIAKYIRRYSDRTALQYAKTIIALLGAGLDPTKDEVDGKTNNYVEILRKAQILDGKNKGRFIIDNFTDEDSIETQAYCILALDSANEKYDVDSAVKALLAMLNDPECTNVEKHLYKEIKAEGIAATALAKHKNIDGVNEKINELIQFFKSKQNKDGSFDLKSGQDFKNSPVATGAVIMALYANGINPLSGEWQNNGNSIINGMLKSKFVGSDASKSGYAQYDYDQEEDVKFENYEATYYAFTAYVELLNKKSIFDMIDANREPNIKTDLKIENITGQKKFTKGREAKITVKATNTSDKVQSATLIVGLFDSQGKLHGELVNYVASTQEIKVGENTELTGRIKLPNADGYTIKAFVWDSIEGMKYLSDEIIIPVE